MNQNLLALRRSNSLSSRSSSVILEKLSSPKGFHPDISGGLLPLCGGGVTTSELTEGFLPKREANSGSLQILRLTVSVNPMNNSKWRSQWQDRQWTHGVWRGSVKWICWAKIHIHRGYSMGMAGLLPGVSEWRFHSDRPHATQPRRVKVCVGSLEFQRGGVIGDLLMIGMLVLLLLCKGLLILVHLLKEVRMLIQHHVWSSQQRTRDNSTSKS